MSATLRQSKIAFGIVLTRPCSVSERSPTVVRGNGWLTFTHRIVAVAIPRGWRGGDGSWSSQSIRRIAMMSLKGYDLRYPQRFETG